MYNLQGRIEVGLLNQYRPLVQHHPSLNSVYIFNIFCHIFYPYQVAFKKNHLRCICILSLVSKDQWKIMERTSEFDFKMEAGENTKRVLKAISSSMVSVNTSSTVLIGLLVLLIILVIILMIKFQHFLQSQEPVFDDAKFNENGTKNVDYGATNRLPDRTLMVRVRH